MSKAHLNSIQKIQKQCETIRNAIVTGDTFSPDVSAKSSYWQLDHLLQVCLSISRVMDFPKDPLSTRIKSPYVRAFVLITTYIPRGGGKAPDIVLPKTDKNQADLLEMLDQWEQKLPKLAQLDPDAGFDHPMFGWFRRDSTLRFIRIHTKHHLKIVHDILKKN